MVLEMLRKIKQHKLSIYGLVIWMKLFDKDKVKIREREREKEAVFITNNNNNIIRRVTKTKYIK
jgi:hypothetical protein